MSKLYKKVSVLPIVKSNVLSISPSSKRRLATLQTLDFTTISTGLSTVHQDESFTWKEHVDAVCIKVNKRLGLLARIRSCLTLEASKSVYNCLILPTLTYADAVWGELSVTCSDNLQRLQNRAARIIMRRDSSSEALNNLGWSDLKTIRGRNKCILVYKCLHDLVPKYLSEYFIRNSSIHLYNTRRKNDIHLPKPKLSLGKCTFRYSGTLLFNSLPQKIKTSTSLPSFKTLIRKHDF